MTVASATVVAAAGLAAAVAVAVAVAAGARAAAPVGRGPPVGAVAAAAARRDPTVRVGADPVSAAAAGEAPAAASLPTADTVARPLSVWAEASRPLLPRVASLGAHVRSKMQDALAGVTLGGGGGGRGGLTGAAGGGGPGRVAGEANIAYFIQVSDSTLTLVPRLLRTLHHPLNVYVLHFDRKIPSWQVDHAVSELRQNGAYTNVHILASELVTYRGISMVLNTLNAVDLLTSLRDTHPWDYMINLSGADYPLVAPTVQRQLLGAADVAGVGRNFVQVAPRPFWAEAKAWRYDRLFIDTALGFGATNSSLIDSGAAQPLASQLQYEFVAAESWMILHADFCDYLLHAPAARRMLMAFGFAAEPEEHYFATLLWNTPQFNASAVRHSLRHVIWVHNGRHGGQHPYTVDVRSATAVAEGGSGGDSRNGDEDSVDGSTSRGATTGTGDRGWSFWPRISRSPAFFIRKMAVANSGLMDLIDAEKSGVSAAPVADAVAASLASVRTAFACVVGLRPEQDPVECIADPDDGAPPTTAAARVAAAVRYQRRRWSHNHVDAAAEGEERWGGEPVGGAGEAAADGGAPSRD